MSDTVCVSGGFDPLHVGHLEMFRDAAKWGRLTVILNSDDWLLRKKGFHFLPWEQRADIIRELRCVAEVVAVDDANDTVCEALQRLKPRYFANGGDRKPGNTPEIQLCETLGIKLLWEIGGSKVHSSTDIARRAWVQRSWGTYVTLDEGDDYKIKKLVVAPGQSTSLQWHRYRSEFWYIAVSDASIVLDDKTYKITHGMPSIVVKSGVRHQLINEGETPLVIIEVQTGPYLAEDDIVRVLT